MKKCLLIVTLLVFGGISVAEAQLREHLAGPGDYTGAVFKTDQSSSGSLGSLMESLKMDMGHSYSMSFGSVGGRYQSLNAYTNHMSFDFSENLTGNVDLSVLHSPFGGSLMSMGNNDLGARIVIDRAQVDYQISPNTSLSVQFSQRPYYSPFGMGSSPGSFRTRNNYWY
ncbi:MAG: hypothetical protein WD317_10145 [Balneolaceae bacterium]